MFEPSLRFNYVLILRYTRQATYFIVIFLQIKHTIYKIFRARIHVTINEKVMITNVPLPKNKWS